MGKSLREESQMMECKDQRKVSIEIGSKRMMEMMSLLIAMEAKVSNLVDVLMLCDGYSGIDAYDVWNGHGLMVKTMKAVWALAAVVGFAWGKGSEGL
ncbi:hypothetical protein Tco_0696824 [Tanacetum coccineum]